MDSTLSSSTRHNRQHTHIVRTIDCCRDGSPFHGHLIGRAAVDRGGCARSGDFGMLRGPSGGSRGGPRPKVLAFGSKGGYEHHKSKKTEGNGRRRPNLDGNRQIWGFRRTHPPNYISYFCARRTKQKTLWRRLRVSELRVHRFTSDPPEFLRHKCVGRLPF